MNTDVEPHDFSPYRWHDRLHALGRCRHCIMPKLSHPVPIWMQARPLQHGQYYSPEQLLATALRRIKQSSREGGGT